MMSLRIFLAIVIVTPLSCLADGVVEPREESLVDESNHLHQIMKEAEVRVVEKDNPEASLPDEPLSVESTDPRDELLALVQEVEALKSKVVSTKQTTLATQTLRRRKKVGAITYYNYQQGQIYELRAGVDRVSDIALEPGEELSGSPIAGDTVRWKIGSTISGLGKATRTHVVVKPLEEGIETNIIIPTNKRTYHIRAMASDWYMPQIAWNYPEQDLGKIEVGKKPEPLEEKVSFSPEDLSFGYEIEGDNTPWRPLRVFDDGRKTYLQMSKELEAREAPVLFLLDEESEPKLVNYRVLGDYYVVDSLFSRAQLRVGKKLRVNVYSDDYKPSLFSRIFR